ncbi:MAG: hypothetical protein DVS81_10820 [Candidatus Accumulibacter meliphilus]|uniref:Uncharacterized protein n=1 Tax=Candidatus Accumulibacter meliphilus TaxID=2211374 RepID=A0A369XK71_9PROT|nr:MAG: hypothetical protein DVS81_10820 [Candidatus Accumulibacter meliphilus]
MVDSQRTGETGADEQGDELIVDRIDHSVGLRPSAAPSGGHLHECASVVLHPTVMTNETPRIMKVMTVPPLPQTLLPQGEKGAS